MVKSRIVKIAAWSAPLGKGTTQADEWFRDLEKRYGTEDAKRIWRMTSI
jgi:hypothetical protein